MPIGGFDNLGWDETSPADTESVGLGDDRIRSLKTSARNALDSEHNWPSGGGNAVGYHRLGSARPFYGAQSTVSSSGSDGRLMQTSDTSQFFHVGSGGTSFIGGSNVISLGTYPGAVPQRAQWMEEVGTATTGSGGTVLVTIPNSGYSGMPYVFVSAYSTGGLNGLPGYPIATAAFIVTATTFVGSAMNAALNSGISGQLVFWRSLGTRAL